MFKTMHDKMFIERAGKLRKKRQTCNTLVGIFPPIFLGKGDFENIYTFTSMR